MENIRKFVIQKHTTDNEVHWDLMLEAGDVLETYRLELPPEQITGQGCPAVKIFGHPLKFLTYQGSVNQGKGNVKITEKGDFKMLKKSQDCKIFQLEGKILKGKFRLVHIEADKWQFYKG